jgi:hypothetical protein
MRRGPFDRFQEIAGNFKQPSSKLKHVTPKAVIYDGFVEGELGAPQACADGSGGDLV